jgi:hypothetical protein
MSNDLRVILNKQYPIDPPSHINFQNTVRKLDVEYTDLCNLMSKYGSEKGGGNEWHNYTRFYDSILKSNRNTSLNLFELGLGTNDPTIRGYTRGQPCGCLRAWSEYLPNSRIWGCDIDSRILITTDKITTFQCDSTNQQSISDMWNQIPVNMNIIIDDGLHEFESGLIFFTNSISKLQVGGMYIIESPLKSECDKWIEYFRLNSNKYTNLKIGVMDKPTNINNVDNRLIIIQKLS